MSDLSAYGSSIHALKEQAQSCRVKPAPLRMQGFLMKPLMATLAISLRFLQSKHSISH